MSERGYLEPAWGAPKSVRALTTLRSAGSFGSAEPGSADALRQLAGLPQEPRWLRQVHGTAVVELDRAPPGEITADAAVSARAGVICAVQTADCLPVLLAASDGSGVAAVHAGWRGLAAGVIESTVGALRRSTTGSIVAWLGPAISAAHFEVGGEVREAFLAADGAAAGCFVGNAHGRWQCDLYELARRRLQRLGIDNVAGGEHCTFAETGRFFSYRRDVGRDGTARTGRMASLIWLERE